MLRTQARAGFVLTAGTPADAERVREFVAGLSLRSQFFRFFASVSTPSSSLLRSLTGAGGRADVLIARDGAGNLVGHGMVVDRVPGDGRQVSDIGVVVADSWQGRGVGSALMRALARRAAGRGSAELVMDVLPENARMLGMIERRWPDARRSRNRDSVTIRASLLDAAGAAARGATPAGAAYQR
ncbi:MAG TPA: GNAT family N-acetyltransferase [Streptosporangiaceae bacterium]|jgi:acetyltransferase|nr:GNAT family N-acetyltransferase [Streptosporangiaceae bacterium]